MAGNKLSALDVLCKILKSGIIHGSKKEGYIKGPNAAVCFSECPLSFIKYFASDNEKKGARYRFYGIAISKKAAFENGARPVIYLPDNEGEWIPMDQKWRHVRFEYGNVDWTFEREWRKKGDLDLNQLPGFYVIHWNPSEKIELETNLREDLGKKVRGFLPMEHLNQMFLTI